MPSATTDPLQDCQRHTSIRNLIERKVEVQDSVKKLLALGEWSATRKLTLYFNARPALDSI
jgi:hypothetical protein